MLARAVLADLAVGDGCVAVVGAFAAVTYVLADDSK